MTQSTQSQFSSLQKVYKITEMPIATNISGRSWKAFIRESTDHGWPSFRDEEVVWDNVRCLRNGECVTLDGIHLGHNLPDGSGNRLQAFKIIPFLLLLA